MKGLLKGTASGLFEMARNDAVLDPGIGERDLTAGSLGSDDDPWAVADRHVLMHRDREGVWAQIARRPDLGLTFVIATPTGLLVGTEEAHLLRPDERSLAMDDGFEAVDGRED